MADLESAINWWRRLAPSADGVQACAAVRALADPYAHLAYTQQDRIAWSALSAKAQQAWLDWYEHQVDAPCIAICSTAQGDAVCKGCGRLHDEVQHWPELNPLQKRTVWLRINHEAQAWRFGSYADRVMPPREPSTAQVQRMLQDLAALS